MTGKRLVARPAVWAAGAAALGASACATPDLTVTRVDVAPTSIEQGADYTVVTEMQNIGRGTARMLDDGRRASVLVELKDSPGAPTGDTLTAWTVDGDFPGGATQGASLPTSMPVDQMPGSYYVCAEADFPELYAESDETNNTRCERISVVAAPRADLIVEGAKTGATSGVSRRIYINVSNVGAADAENFRIDVFQLAPELWPLLVTECAMTTHPGGSAPCPSPFIERLRPGETATVEAWVTFPEDRAPGSVERVRIMADGCHPPTEPVSLQPWCRVIESDEGNNEFEISITVP